MNVCEYFLTFEAVVVGVEVHAFLRELSANTELLCTYIVHI